jgi:prepilin-type N-terminal cleavage/methylation domain-containing protein
MKIRPIDVASRGRRRPTRSAFTLIELLVVVAIIGILIAILIPSLSHAKEISRRSVCLSNQKEIARGCLIYQDLVGSLPGPILPCTFAPQMMDAAITVVDTPGSVSDPQGMASGTGTAWRKRQLSGYNMLGGNETVPVSNPDKGALSVITGNGVWVCPSATDIYLNATPVGASSSYQGKKMGYSYIINNQIDTNPKFFFGYWGTYSTDSSGSPIPSSSTYVSADYRPKKTVNIVAAGVSATSGAVTNPSEIWMLGDLDSRNFDTGVSGDFGIAVTSTNRAAYPFPPSHGAGYVSSDSNVEAKEGSTGFIRNYVFFDTHAETCTYPKMPSNSCNLSTQF